MKINGKLLLAIFKRSGIVQVCHSSSQKLSSVFPKFNEIPFFGMDTHSIILFSSSVRSVHRKLLLFDSSN